MNTYAWRQAGRAYWGSRAGGSRTVSCKSGPLRSPSALSKWMLPACMSYFHIWHWITFEKCQHKHSVLNFRVQRDGSLLSPSPRRPPCIYLINSELFNLIELERKRGVPSLVSPLAYFKASGTSLQRFLCSKISPPSTRANNFTILWTGEQLSVGVYFLNFTAPVIVFMAGVRTNNVLLFLNYEFLIL